MRRQRERARRSQARAVYRAGIAEYMNSEQWQRRRMWWVGEYRRRNDGADPACAVCDAPWADSETGRTLDLHHRAYDNVGAEAFEDLIPMCRDHHEQLHRVLDTYPQWRTMARRTATDALIGRLRTRWLNHQPVVQEQR